MPLELASVRARQSPTPSEQRVIEFLAKTPGSAFTAAEVAKGLFETPARPPLPSPWSLANEVLRPLNVAFTLEGLAGRGEVARLTAGGRTWYHLLPRDPRSGPPEAPVGPREPRPAGTQGRR